MHKFTVSDINRIIKQILLCEDIFCGINIVGEISNFKYHSCGNMYFTLKDDKSCIRCVMFKEQAEVVNFMPKDGMYVLTFGDIGVYEAYGQYQLYVSAMEKYEEEGILKKKLTKLKAKLVDEGLFNAENKKSIPKIPSVVGVVTAKGGAAIEDIKKIASRRFPLATLKVYFALMQGKKSKNSIISALKYASKGNLDVLILARGGGAQEDLEVFNNEEVVREIWNFKIPTVSAVGHENDWSLVDLVADVRASTPSAAAEIVFPDIFEIQNRLENFKALLKTYIKNIFDDVVFKFKMLKKDINFVSPFKTVNFLEHKIENFRISIYNSIFNRYNYCYDNLQKYIFLLKYLNPYNILKKGYGLILDINGKAVRSLYKSKVGNVLNIHLKDGTLKVQVLEKKFKNI